MMDGSLLSGVIRETLSPDRSRLFDYLNNADEPFIRLYNDPDTVCLVNKSYIIHAVSKDDGDIAKQP
jgi:hypothetical protein